MTKCEPHDIEEYNQTLENNFIYSYIECSKCGLKAVETYELVDRRSLDNESNEDKIREFKELEAN